MLLQSALSLRERLTDCLEPGLLVLNDWLTGDERSALQELPFGLRLQLQFGARIILHLWLRQNLWLWLELRLILNL